MIGALEQGGALPSENNLALQLGVSRTTVRKVLAALRDEGAIGGAGRARIVRLRRMPTPFPDAETVPVSTQIERRFMEWMHRGDARPGSVINELELARQFGVATTVIREFLNSFQRFGLIEKRPNGGWLLQGFTIAFALELFEIREMFELRSAHAFASLPPTSPLWHDLAELRARHVALLGDIDARFNDFAELDSAFHRLVNEAAPNRFIDDFYDIITLIFHYHYQWSKHDERQRNEVAIREHLTYIDALQSRDPRTAERACRAHLTSARETLIRSTGAEP